MIDARRGPWGMTFLAAGLACMATILFAFMFRQPASMVGAISRVEASRAAWEEIEDRFMQLLNSDADGSGRGAVAGLLNRVHAVAEGRADAGKSFDDSISYVAADSTNLVSRIAYALLQDMKNEASTVAASGPAGGSADAMTRFLAMREIVEGASAVNRAAIYNASLFDAWRSSLDGYFARPDVAASLAMQTRYFMRGDLRIGCWTVLPLLSGRLMSLASELRAAGFAAEADACGRWVARCMLGVLRTERDAPTRLLAADLMARAAVSADAKVIRDSAGRFRRDFHLAADRASIDFCDQGYVSAKSVAPSEFRTAALLLIGSVSLALIGAGAAAAFLITITVLPFFAFWRWRQGTAIPHVHAAEQAPRKSNRMDGLIAVALSMVASGILTYRLATDRFYSESIGIYLAILLTGAGSAIALAVGSLHGKGRMLTAMPTVAFILLLLLPVSVHAWSSRVLGLTLGSEFVALTIVVGLVATAAILAGIPLRSIARGSATVWLVGMVLANVVFLAHGAADRKYSTAAAAGYLDEVAARLGADWEQTYFKEAIERYDVTAP